jgi:hypothetical protein
MVLQIWHFDTAPKILAWCQTETFARCVCKSVTFKTWRIWGLSLWWIVNLWRSSWHPWRWRGRTFSCRTTLQCERLYGFHRPHRWGRRVLAYSLRLCRHIFTILSKKVIKDSSHTLRPAKTVFSLPFTTQFSDQTQSAEVWQTFHTKIQTTWFSCVISLGEAWSAIWVYEVYFTVFINC